MKVMLVNPVNREAIAYQLIGMRAPYLGIFQLVRMTPEEFDLKVVDEVIEDYDYENDPFSPDLVAIFGCFTADVIRAYEVADIYRKRGIPVVMGGVHVSFMPEEASQHADSVVVGEGEEIWGTVLADAKKGKLQPVYKAEPPDLSKVEYKRRNPLLDIPSVDTSVVAKLLQDKPNSSDGDAVGGIGRWLRTPILGKAIASGV
jgi:radical SAM superfamily enzyme YgiQ (UPF0313 family)